MKNRIFIIFAFFMAITSCNSHKMLRDVVNINLYKDSLIHVELDMYKFSLLYSPELIGAIELVQFSDKKEFLLKTGKTLLLYSLEGGYINSVSRFGRASEEYLSILDFGFKKDSLYLYDMNGKKMMLFNEKGNYLRNYPLPEGAEVNPFQLIIPIGDQYIGKRMYCGLPSYPELSLYDSDFRFVKPINESSMHLRSGMYFSSQFTPFSNESVLYNRSFDTKIYEVTRDTAIVRYNVVFDDKTIDIDKYKDEYEILNKINENKVGYSTLLENFEFYQGVLTFSYAYTGDKNGYRIAFYDSNTRKSEHYAFTTDEQIAYVCAHRGVMYVFAQTEDGQTRLYHIPFIDNNANQ